MKIAFVSSPCPVLLHGDEPWSPVRTNTWPQSQVALATALLGEGFDLELLDLRSIANPSGWREELGPEYISPIQYGEYKLTRHLIGDYRSRIASCPADVYVVTGNFTAEANAVRETIRTIKELWPKAIVLVGGRDASAPERHGFYFNSGADCIGIGDGDVSLGEFLLSLKRDGKPASRIIAGGIPKEFRPNMPDFSFRGLDLTRYKESGGGPMHPGVFHGRGFTSYLETSRGCPRECDFCTERQTERWALDVPETLGLIQHYRRAGCQLFGITDDNLLIRKDSELVEIFSVMRDMEVAWEFPSGIEVGLLCDKQTGRFKEELFRTLFWNNGGAGGNFAGLHRLLVPLEDAFLREAGSGLVKLRQVQKNVGGLINCLLDTGIPFFNVSIMVGSIMETEEDRKRLEENLEVLYRVVEKSSTRVNFSIFCTSPLPGTPLGRMITETGRLAFPIEEAPELWTVATSVVNGVNFSAVQTTEFRRRVLGHFGMLQLDGKVQPPPK